MKEILCNFLVHMLQYLQKKMKKKFFFADENMKKMSSKVDHKRPISFSMYLLTIGQKPVQISISVP